MMQCGDFYKTDITIANIQAVANGATYWLDVYHKARVLHRDIRIRNIMRFDPSPVYSHYMTNKKRKYCSSEKQRGEISEAKKNSSRAWQLIDFSVGHCLSDNEETARTVMQVESKNSYEARTTRAWS
jgi:hypothetical protein